MADKIYDLDEARTRLSRLVDRAAKGEEIIIAKDGVAQAKLVPLRRPAGKRRRPGGWEGKVRISSDFDAPLPRELRTLFEGGS